MGNIKTEKELELLKKLDSFYQYISSYRAQVIGELQKYECKNPDFERGQLRVLSEVLEKIKYWENKQVRVFE